MTPLPSRLSRPAVVAGILFTPLTAFANAPDWEAFVENCQSTDIIACQKKVRVELDIDYDTRGETLIAVIDQVDNDGIPLTLDAPIEVSFSADRPLSTHTTTHFHTVSFRPLEEVIKVPNAVVGIEACVDSPFATFPSCGRWRNY